MHTHAHTCTCLYTDIPMHTQKRAHTHIHTHTHIYTHTHTHTRWRFRREGTLELMPQIGVVAMLTVGFQGGVLRAPTEHRMASDGKT